MLGRDLFRETIVGKVIHKLSGGKVLQYPEEEEGFVCPNCYEHGAAAKGSKAPQNDQEGAVTPAGDDGPTRSGSDGETVVAPVRTISRGGEEFTLVDWYGDDDPANPYNWSAGKKAWVMMVLCILTFAVYVGSSLITSGWDDLQREFDIPLQEATVTLSIYVFGYGAGALLFSPLSEIPALGRNPFYWGPMAAFTALQVGAATTPTFTGLVLLRLITALCGAPALATGGGTVTDLFKPDYIPLMLACWTIFAFMGPGLGPVFGNFAAQANGWRWTMWELLWVVGFATILLWFTMPETSHSNILLRRAERLRAITGNQKLRSESEIKMAEMQPKQIIFDSLVKPFEITIKDPSIAYVNFYVGVLYAIYYTFFDAFPIVFGDVFHFSFGAEGVAYLSVAVGGILGFVIYAAYQVFFVPGYIQKHGWPAPEFWLIIGAIFSTFQPIGLFIFAWTGREGSSWVGPEVGIALLVLSNFIVVQVLFFYIVLAYPVYAASILASNDFIRASFACGMIHAGVPMFRAMTLSGGVSFLAGLTVLCIPPFWYLVAYGHKLRARSRFAVGDDTPAASKPDPNKVQDAEAGPIEEKPTSAAPTPDYKTPEGAGVTPSSDAKTAEATAKPAATA